MIPIHPALARALQAGPVVGMQHIITDARGEPLRSLDRFDRESGQSARVFRRDASRTDCARLRFAGSPSMGRRRKKSPRCPGTVRCLKSSGTRLARIRLGLRDSAIAKLPDADDGSGSTNYGQVSRIFRA